MRQRRGRLAGALLPLLLLVGCTSSRSVDLSTLAPLSDQERVTPQPVVLPSGSAPSRPVDSSPPTAPVVEQPPALPTALASPTLLTLPPPAPSVPSAPSVPPAPSPVVTLFPTPTRIPTPPVVHPPSPPIAPTPVPRPTPVPKPRPPVPPRLTTAQVAAALLAAPSINATVTEGTLRATLAYVGARSEGHFDVSGRPIDFVLVGPTLYVSASAFDWSTYGGVSIAAARSMGRQWFRTSVAQFSAAPYAFLFLRSGLTAALTRSAGPGTSVTFAMLRGRPVLAVHLKSGRILYASAAGSPRPVQLATTTRSFGFSYGGGSAITVPSPTAKVP